MAPFVPVEKGRKIPGVWYSSMIEVMNEVESVSIETRDLSWLPIIHYEERWSRVVVVFVVGAVIEKRKKEMDTTLREQFLVFE